MTPKRIALVGFDGVTALHLVAPAEAFCAAALDDGYGGRIPCYEVCTLGVGSERFRTESGLQFTAEATLSDAAEFDTIIVAGGNGIRGPRIADAIAAWLLERANETRRFGSVCSGVFALAATGLLDGRAVTVHWRHATQLAKRFPTLRVNHKSALTQDGRYYSARGLSAGLNLALAMIEEDYGAHVAAAVRRDLTITAAAPEQAPATALSDRGPNERFADLVPWIVRNLDGDLSVETLARRACMCPSHFSKAFKSVFGQPPKVFVENLRLNEARRRLSKRQRTLQSVANSVGFTSSSNFRRAFERRFGAPPSSYLTQWPSKAEAIVAG
jgi:transcriptional regulator GlxA family with amidase domain